MKFHKIYSKTPVQARNFIIKGTLAQVFSCEFCKISKNTYSYRTPLDECFFQVPLIIIIIALKRTSNCKSGFFGSVILESKCVFNLVLFFDATCYLICFCKYKAINHIFYFFCNSVLVFTQFCPKIS